MSVLPVVGSVCRNACSSAVANASGSWEHTAQPLVRPTICETSPTSVETTGTLQAIASLTTLGDPSVNEVRMSALLALMYWATCSCGKPLATTSSASIPLACSRSTAACASGNDEDSIPSPGSLLHFLGFDNNGIHSPTQPAANSRNKLPKFAISSIRSHHTQ